MPAVNIQIGRRAFPLACSEGQEAHLQQLAVEVSERVEMLEGSMGSSNDTLLLVASALMMQDEINDLRSRSGNDDSDDAITEAINAIADYVETIAERIEKA